MNELRLAYKKETGKDVHSDIHFDEVAYIIWKKEIPGLHEPDLDLSSWYEIKEYIEWLENKLGS